MVGLSYNVQEGKIMCKILRYTCHEHILKCNFWCNSQRQVQMFIQCKYISNDTSKGKHEGV